MARMSGTDRRKQIVTAAIEVILRKGLAAAATRDVTRAIGAGAGLLHHYFPSWDHLRAEAVRQAASVEIEEVREAATRMSPAAALDHLADWMVEDDDMRHWRLWLNALDEAHRDELLADVMNEAMAAWHGLIAELLHRYCEDAGVALADADLSAWRLAALMDGLAGMMLVKGSTMTPGGARKMIGAQLEMEMVRRADV